MNTTPEFVGGTIGTAFGMLGYSLSVSEIQAIVSMVATILGLILTFISAIIIPVWKQWRAAKKDGKITPEEVEDIVDTVKDGIDKVKKDK